MTRVFISRTERNATEKKLVGAQIPKVDANRLALISLEKNVPRTAILLELINCYLQMEDDLPTMIERAANRALTAWKEDGQLESIVALDLFCKQLAGDLKTHRIEKDIIELIIKKFRELI